MERNHVLGMICGYYLSRFDSVAYSHLGYSSQQATNAAPGCRSPRTRRVNQELA